MPHVEDIGLSLSGAMIFFFNVIYIQYHINRIARWKKTGVLSQIVRKAGRNGFTAYT